MTNGSDFGYLAARASQLAPAKIAKLNLKTDKNTWRCLARFSQNRNRCWHVALWSVFALTRVSSRGSRPLKHWSGHFLERSCAWKNIPARHSPKQNYLIQRLRPKVKLIW